MNKDDVIQQKVQERLLSHPDIHGLEIVVEVDRGKVTLHGKVKDRKQARLAAAEAYHEDGVLEVVGDLDFYDRVEGHLPGVGPVDREESSGGFTEKDI